jgi:hypothetical protein
MSSGVLRIEGDKVVDGNGNSVILRGAGLGGWMKYVNHYLEPIYRVLTYS